LDQLDFTSVNSPKAERIRAKAGGQQLQRAGFVVVNLLLYGGQHPLCLI
jgi:hypothetical protein